MVEVHLYSISLWTWFRLVSSYLNIYIVLLELLFQSCIGFLDKVLSEAVIEYVKKRKGTKTREELAITTNNNLFQFYK